MAAMSANRANIVDLSKKQLEKDELQLMLQRVADSQCKAAFAKLFHHFSPMLKSFALANPYGDNPRVFAEELIQEVMIKVWNKAASYKPKYAGVTTWIFTIARNTRIDMIRKNSRYQYPLESEELFDFEDENATELFQQLQQQYYEKDIKNMFKQLPNDLVQIIAKFYLEGKSHSQIAEDMQLPLGTVKSRVRLALAKLKVMMVH